MPEHEFDRYARRYSAEINKTLSFAGKDQDFYTRCKVPILADIPWVGPLFQSRHENKTKTELLIFLTPHVAQRPDQLQVQPPRTPNFG